jgi:hypothetical protein
VPDGARRDAGLTAHRAAASAGRGRIGARGKPGGNGGRPGFRERGSSGSSGCWRTPRHDATNLRETRSPPFQDKDAGKSQSNTRSMPSEIPEGVLLVAIKALVGLLRQRIARACNRGYLLASMFAATLTDRSWIAGSRLTDRCGRPPRQKILSAKMSRLTASL